MRRARIDQLSTSGGTFPALFDEGFDSRRQFKNGLCEWLVAHGFICESSTVLAGAGGVSGGDQRATKIPILIKNGERERLGRVVGLEAIANKQSGRDVVELVVVFSPVGRAVQPIAPMPLKIADASELERFEIIRLVQRVLEIGIAADRAQRSPCVDFRTLGGDGPGHVPVESRGYLRAVDAGELEERLKRFRIVDEGRFAGRCVAFHFATYGHGLHLRDGLLAAEGVFVAVENLGSRCELRCLGPGAGREQEHYDDRPQETGPHSASFANSSAEGRRFGDVWASPNVRGGSESGEPGPSSSLAAPLRRTRG